MSMIDLERRSMLRGHPVARSFPPWAVNDFIERCNRCNACVEACETGMLVRGDGGFPRADFSRAGCTFCAACVEVCREAAFGLPLSCAPWALRASLGEGCLAVRGVVCRACEEACAVAAIRFRPQPGGRTMLEIDAETCTGCGACVGTCPVEALTMEEAA